MKVRIVDDLLSTIESFFGESSDHRNSEEFIALCERIQGREVDVVFILGDAFEAIDNNWWLPECCWSRID